jgi:hypothetical protein
VNGQSRAQGGLRVNLFSDQDIPGLLSLAGRPLAKGVRPPEVAGRLNMAVYGAYMAAEQSRIQLARSDLEKRAADVRQAGRQLLQALGLPGEPQAYTREGLIRRGPISDKLFASSPIAYWLRRVAAHCEPLPDPKITADPKGLSEIEVERLAVEAVDIADKIPLTKGMVPTSIAMLGLQFELIHEIIYPRAKELYEHVDIGLLQLEAKLAVGLLLDMAPSAIALVVALSDMLASQSDYGRTDKQNYNRTFIRSLFRHLASAYFHAFGKRPNAVDNAGDREGPAAHWADHVLKLAARRTSRIEIVRAKSPRDDLDGAFVAEVALADETERERLVSQIRVVARLKIAVKGKRLEEGWRLRRRMGRDPGVPESS